MASIPHTPDNAGLRRQQVLSQLWRLLELTRDMERNKDDNRFVERGGRIDYLFDENVFELLIDPRRHSHFVRLFHTGAMNSTLRKADRDSISAQSALVTAEYLFFGHLPGQAPGRPIHLSEWHFAELTSRFFDMAQEAHKRLPDRPPPPPDPSLLVTADHLTRADLEAFRAAAKDGSGLWDFDPSRFIAARAAARRMVESDPLQVLMQLRRLGTKELTSRVTPLTEPKEFRPSRDDARRIREGARDWRHRLERELELQGSEHFAARTPGALENDALTLSQLLWLSRERCSSRRRCVLVTGDRLIFGAYRRWHVEEPPGTPFLVRRVSQFAPIINFRDAHSDVSSFRDARSDMGNPHAGLFIQTRGAVEAAMLAFGLGNATENDPVARGREYLALRLSELAEEGEESTDLDRGLEFFAPRLTPEWVKARRDAFETLNEGWALVERFAIAANYDLVIGRYQAGEGTVLRTPSLPGAAHDTYAAFVHNLMQELTADAIKLFFPLVIAYIRRPAIKSHRDMSSRAPDMVRLHLPGTADAADEPQVVAALIRRWALGEQEALELLDPDRNSALVERPSFVFAVASAIALLLGNWADAERFSSVAAAGSGAMLANDVCTPSLVDDHYELLYLNAVAKRFRLGMLSPQKSGATSDLWAELRDMAVSNLDRCADHHGDRGESLRALRAVSERAATRLFYVAWAVLTPTDTLRARKFAVEDAPDQLKAALRDLEDCLFRLGPATMGRESSLDPTEQGIADRIKVQYLVNASAATALGHFLGTPLDTEPPSLSVEGRDELVRQLDAMEPSKIERHAFMLPDILAFRALSLGDDRARRRLAEFDPRAVRPLLAIDQELLAKYMKIGISSGL